MNATAKFFAVTLAALSFAAANTVLAQPGMGMGMGPTAGASAGMGPGMRQGMGPGTHGRMAAETPAVTQARLGDLKAALKITPAQEAAWKGYADVVAQQAQAREAARAQMQAKMQDPALTPAERTAQRDAMMKVREQHLADRGAAIKGLQAVLTPEQRAIADQQLQPTRGHRMAGRGGHGGHGMWR